MLDDLLVGSLMALALAACGPDDADSLRSFTPVAGRFEYTAGGYGFDAMDNLLLVGPMESVRWNARAQAAERFGGPLDANSGRILRDGAGNLILHGGANALAMLSLESGSTWTNVELPDRYNVDAADPRVYSTFIATNVEIDRAGTVFALGDSIQAHADGTSTAARVLLRRSRGNPTPEIVGEYAASAGQMTSIPGVGNVVITGMSVRGDGTVFLTGTTLVAIPAGTTVAHRVFDCSVVVGRYCGATGVLTNPRSDIAYVDGPWRLPEGTSFPIVPEAVDPGPAPQLRPQFRVDEDGTLWAAQNVPEEVTVDYPPYLLDVTHLRRLDGTSWSDVSRFVTPSFTWVQNDHGRLYSFGRQLAAGGIWVPWGVYELAL